MALLKIKQVDGLQTSLDALGGNATVDNFSDGGGFTAGSSNSVTLSIDPLSENNVLAIMDGVVQHHDTFSVAGTTLTFDSTIPAGTQNIQVIIGPIMSGGNVARTDTAQEYTKAQNFNATTLSDGANISWDAESNQVTSVTLGGNRTLDNPTNIKDGATYILVVKQSTGSHTLSYGSAYKFPGGTAPTLSTGAGAVDVLTFICHGTDMLGVAQLDFS